MIARAHAHIAHHIQCEFSDIFLRSFRTCFVCHFIEPEKDLCVTLLFSDINMKYSIYNTRYARHEYYPAHSATFSIY